MNAQQTRHLILVLGRLLAPAHSERADAAATMLNDEQQLAHLRWMVSHMEDSRAWETDLEKTQRWLGFIQGVLWAHGVCSIDALREQVQRSMALEVGYDG